MTVAGSNFQAGATVLFGGVAASSVTVSSASQIQAVTPAHIAGTTDVTVRNADSQSMTLSSSFTYRVASPTIIGISPNTGSTAGGTTVTITGTNFQTGALVLFGTVSATTVTVNSATQIQAVTPSNAAGAVNVAVQNPDGLTATLTGGFDYSPSGKYIFQDDFESDNFNSWNNIINNPNICAPSNPAVCNWAISTSTVHSGGHSARSHYASGISGDDNGELSKSFSPALQHYHLRGYVYFENNGGNLSSGIDIQRKLIWLRHNEGSKSWSLILTTHSNGGSNLQLLLIDQSCSGQPFYQYYNTGLSFNTWYSIEIEMQVNTLGQNNGFWNLWINGTPANFTGQGGTGTTGIKFEQPCTNLNSNGIDEVWIGQQLESPAGVRLDEYRYWDDVAVGDSYIGLTQ